MEKIIVKNNKESIAHKNSEVLLEVLEVLEKINDKMQDITLNSKKILDYIKAQEDRDRVEDPNPNKKKSEWIFF